METYGGSGCIAPSFLTATLDGGECSAVRPSRYFPLYSLDRRFGAAQNRSGQCTVVKKLLLLLGIEPWPSSLSY
jgi:hypothetical protein